MGLKDYVNEADNFRKNFSKFRDKKIVLYGIGRFTASLIPLLSSEYNFVGLMDKNPVNIGTSMYGLPIISAEETESIADLIVINTSKTYWDVIYERIHSIDVPVYYLDGRKAEWHENEDSYDFNNSYWNLSLQNLRSEIDKVDIISFDVFDTLLMRKVYLPDDVFHLVDIFLPKDSPLKGKFFQLRKNAQASVSTESNLDEIYLQIKHETSLDEKFLNKAKDLEMFTEEKVICPRKDIVQLCNETLQKGKSVYFLSDMYLSKQFIKKLLESNGISCVPIEHILVSSDIKMCKKSEGSLWDYYKERIVLEKKALHIGDDIISDIENANKRGINTYHLMNVRDMLKISSLRDIEPFILTTRQSLIMGIILSKIFNSPFALNKTKGRLFCDSTFIIGRCLFGSILVNFLFWLIKNTINSKVKNIYFFARDGYFLEKIYNYMISKCKGEFPFAHYLLISRKLLWTASMEDENDLEELVYWPYAGSFAELMNKRLDIIVDERTVEVNNQDVNYLLKSGNLLQFVKMYDKEIWNNVIRDKKNYSTFIKNFNFNENFVIVDIGYRGTTQKYLSKFLKKNIDGYYIVTNQKNVFITKHGNKNIMYSCYLYESDDKKLANISSKILFIESFLTAPYGMIKRIDENGNMVCDEEYSNQKYFSYKEELKEGIFEYIDELDKVGVLEYFLSIDRSDLNFIDNFYGEFFSKKTLFSEEAKKSFFYDNNAMRVGENEIFS